MTVDKVKLKALAEAATPQDFDSAEEKSGNGYIECPHCGGQGEVELEADYCNYDGTAIGVQFYGIGSEHGAAEAYYRAANPAAMLTLLAEIESLSKDLESHKRMLLSAAVSIGAIGEALGAEMDDDQSELEGLAAELRKDAGRFRFVVDCPIRTMVALSRKATDAAFDLEAECDRLMSKIASKKTGD